MEGREKFEKQKRPVVRDRRDVTVGRIRHVSQTTGQPQENSEMLYRAGKKGKRTGGRGPGDAWVQHCQTCVEKKGKIEKEKKKEAWGEQSRRKIEGHLKAQRKNQQGGGEGNDWASGRQRNLRRGSRQGKRPH